MVIALILLTLWAIAAAIGAISRVQKQMSVQTPTRNIPAAPPEPSPLQERESPAASHPEMEVDRDLDQPLSPPELPTEIIETDIPFAASLTVSELLEPVETEKLLATESLMHGSGEAQPSSEPSAENHHNPLNLLEEIAELEPAGHDRQIAHLSHYVSHADSVMRGAAAVALGELAAKTHGEERDKIVALLQQFNQDSDPQVRLQATTALGSIV
jgi:hypothetical protein